MVSNWLLMFPWLVSGRAAPRPLTAWLVKCRSRHLRLTAQHHLLLWTLRVRHTSDKNPWFDFQNLELQTKSMLGRFPNMAILVSFWKMWLVKCNIVALLDQATPNWFLLPSTFSFLAVISATCVHMREKIRSTTLKKDTGFIYPPFLARYINRHKLPTVPKRWWVFIKHQPTNNLPPFSFSVGQHSSPPVVNSWQPPPSTLPPTSASRT